MLCHIIYDLLNIFLKYPLFERRQVFVFLTEMIYLPVSGLVACGVSIVCWASVAVHTLSRSGSGLSCITACGLLIPCPGTEPAFPSSDHRGSSARRQLHEKSTNMVSPKSCFRMKSNNLLWPLLFHTWAMNVSERLILRLSTKALLWFLGD